MVNIPEVTLRFDILRQFVINVLLGDYQAGVNQFQAAVRKRESMRLKLQMNSAPGILEKELMNKMKVEESVCQVCVNPSRVSVC